MNEVLLVPELRENLMSVKRLASAGVDVHFTGRAAILKHNGRTIATAFLRGSLYEIEINLEQRTTNLCQVEDVNLWHKRLGHLSESGMKAIVANQLAEGINFTSEKLKFCDPCVQRKLCRNPFKGTRPRAKRLLERIHTDVCGPIDPVAYGGSRYFVSFVDDYSHYAVVYALKKKSEVFEKFRDYEAKATALFGVKISKLTLDQGREYVSKEQLHFYSQKGIHTA